MTLRTFVLVQGAWGSSASWTPVADLLRAAGHAVHVPSLTGLGERRHLFSGAVNLSTHVDDVVGAIETEGLSDIVLCGHSYGGMVISGVAERLAPRIESLVYLDAFVPEDGQSLMDIIPVEHRLANLAQAGDNLGVGVPPLARHADRVPKDYLHYMEKRSMQPLASMVERVRLTGAREAIARRLYVSAVLEQAPQFTEAFERLSKDPAWEAVTIETGHMLQLEKPREVADILVKFASGGRA